MGQLALQGLQVRVSQTVNGIEMGVLADGTAYMTGRALARLCGIRNSSISEATADWTGNAPGQRTTRLARWLEQQGVRRESLYVRTEQPVVAGHVAYPYPEDVVTRVVEYYAYDAENTTEAARHNFRALGRAGVRAFIYHQLGFDPSSAVPRIAQESRDGLRLEERPR